MAYASAPVTVREYKRRLSHMLVGQDLSYLSSEDWMKAFRQLQDLYMFYANEERQQTFTRVNVAERLDRLRWNVLGPHLYTMCSMEPYKPLMEIQAELLNARAEELSSNRQMPGCTVSDIVSLCQLKSVSRRELDDSLMGTVCDAQVPHTTRLVRENALEELRGFEATYDAITPSEQKLCKIEVLDCNIPEDKARITEYAKQENDDTFPEIQPLTRTIEKNACVGDTKVYIALTEDDQVCGSMKVFTNHDEGYVEIEFLASRKIYGVTQYPYTGKRLIGALVNDMQSNDSIYMLKLQALSNAIPMYVKAGLMTFNLGYMHWEMKISMFMDLRFGAEANLHIDLFRHMYHCIIQKDPVALSFTLSSIKPILRDSPTARAAFNNSELVENVVMLIASVQDPRLLWVYALYLNLPSESSVTIEEVIEEVPLTSYSGGKVPRYILEMRQAMKEKASRL